MAFTAKGTDRFAFGALYVLVCLVTLWFGFRLLNHALAIRFFKDYLVQWETGLSAFNVHQGLWPAFSGSNHIRYMDELANRMTQAGVTLPNSNTAVAYRYRIERFGHSTEEIFVLGFNDRLILFGLSNRSIRHLDQALDGHTDLTTGRVSGRLGKSGKTYIGQVRI